MDKLKEQATSELREARAELLAIRKEDLTGQAIHEWFKRWLGAFRRAKGLSAPLIELNINDNYMRGHWGESDPDVCVELRARVVGLLDRAIVAIDQTQTVKPILDELILGVADTKLSELLKEFNAIKDTAPNSAAIAFRTILTLIIQVRAQHVAPGSDLATRDDLIPERDIKLAMDEKIFSSAETKLLRRYLKISKDVFDNVVHKPGAVNLVTRDDLDVAVNLLNRLLPSIQPE